MGGIERGLLRKALSRIAGGSIDVIEGDEIRHFGPSHASGLNTIHLRLEVHDQRVYRRAFREGSVGLGESFADGWWSTDDLTGLLRLAHQNLRRTHPTQDRIHRYLSPILDPLARRRRPDKEVDRANIRAHYDLGNEFFTQILDDSMMYSCAIFEGHDCSLFDASHAKMNRLAEMLELAPGDHLLDIGTGWGGFAIHAAQHHGCRVTATTISERQFQFVQKRVHDEGMEHLITVLDQDYRDLRGTFDKAVAIEMIEAVDWRDYETFFQHVRTLLRDSGLLAMQAITVSNTAFDRTKRHTDFIKAAIFPGGCLPSIQALTGAAQRSGGLSLASHTDIGLHYAETLRRWRTNLSASRSGLASVGLDERFARLWEFYFAYCEAGFDERYISAAQLLYATPSWRPRSLQRPPLEPLRAPMSASLR